MDAGLSRFNCRKIVSSLTGMPSRCIKFTPATTHPVANQPDNLSHPFNSSHVGRSNLGQPVGEGPSPASSVSTLPPVQCVSQLDPEQASPGGGGYASNPMAGDGRGLHP